MSAFQRLTQGVSWKLKRNLFLLLGTMVFLVQHSLAQEAERFDLEWSGFAKLNATYDTKDLGGSDLFKPSSIPVPSPDHENQDFFMGVKQSRIGLAATLATDAGTIKAYIEGDFHNTSSGSPDLLRIRHAYLQYENWLLGQTWSTFFDIETNPSQVDFEGPNSSTLNRTPMIRYTNALSEKTDLNIAIEHPTEEITATGDIGASNQRFPDVVASLKLLKSSGGHLTVAGVGREIRYSASGGDFKGSFAYGGLVTGKVTTSGKDNLKFQVTGGDGIARYIEGVRGLGYDAVVNTAEDKLEPLFVLGSFLAYQHFWNATVHSSVIAGDLRLEETDLLSANDFSSGSYFAVNLFWQPVHHVNFGVEFLYGVRENQDGQSATAGRIQFGGQLAFK